jgi:hypothetical protein
MEEQTTLNRGVVDERGPAASADLVALVNGIAEFWPRRTMSSQGSHRLNNQLTRRHLSRLFTLVQVKRGRAACQRNSLGDRWGFLGFWSARFSSTSRHLLRVPIIAQAEEA